MISLSNAGAGGRTQGAALNLTEGMSTGLGGDCFILYKPAGKMMIFIVNDVDF